MRLSLAILLLVLGCGGVTETEIVTKTDTLYVDIILPGDPFEQSAAVGYYTTDSLWCWMGIRQRLEGEFEEVTANFVINDGNLGSYTVSGLIGPSRDMMAGVPVVFDEPGDSGLVLLFTGAPATDSATWFAFLTYKGVN